MSKVAEKTKKQEEAVDDEEFVVGTIKGMEDDEEEKKQSQPKDTKQKTAKKQSDKPEDKQAESAENVTLKIRTEEVAKAIVKQNPDASMEKVKNHYEVTDRYIFVDRKGLEDAVGDMSDGVWKLVFVNRTGEIRKFDNLTFAIGDPEKDREIEDTDRKAQINNKIRVDIKQQMEDTRPLLVMTQAEFIEAAIEEYVEKVKGEMI